MAAEIFLSNFAPKAILGFNEAAANGRGNHVEVAVLALDRPASMRPRRMAAEIEVQSAGAGEALVASMRPRRMAAEITARCLEFRQ